MDEREWLAERFEEHRIPCEPRPNRMLGSLSEADDAVQEACLRLSRTDAGQVENLGGSVRTRIACARNWNRFRLATPRSNRPCSAWPQPSSAVSKLTNRPNGRPPTKRRPLGAPV